MWVKNTCTETCGPYPGKILAHTPFSLFPRFMAFQLARRPAFAGGPPVSRRPRGSGAACGARPRRLRSARSTRRCLGRRAWEPQRATPKKRRFCDKWLWVKIQIVPPANIMVIQLQALWTNAFWRKQMPANWPDVRTTMPA